MIQLHNGLLVSYTDYLLVGDERLSKWGDCDARKCYKALRKVYELCSVGSRNAIADKAAEIARARVNKAIDAGQVSMVVGKKLFDWELLPPTIPEPSEEHELFQRFFNEEYKRIFSEKFEMIEKELFNGEVIESVVKN